MDDNTQNVLVYMTAAQWLLSMMVVIVEYRKRKRHAHTPIGKICYGPIEERDRERVDYLNYKIWKNDVICVNMLRFTRQSFFRFCDLIRERGLLQDTIHVCVEQQVAMFLHTIGHNLKNRVVGTNFGRSGESVSRYFNKVLHAIEELCNDFIRPPSSATSAKILGNSRWDPYFKVRLVTTSLGHYVTKVLGLLYNAYILSLHC
jgi:hypothetical protein